MAQKIRYQINGQLADNTVTADNTEDVILVPVNIGSADEDRIVAEMLIIDSSLPEEALRHVMKIEREAVERLILSGYNVNTGLYYARAAFRGVIEGSQWNPQKNSIVVNFSVGASLREAIKNTAVNILGAKGSAMYIGGSLDVSTRAQDATATPGRAFTLTGDLLKVAGTDPSVGIVFIAADGTQTRVTEDLYVTNGPKQLTFIVPPGLANGTYELRVTTQYSSAKRELKSPRSVSKTVYIGEAPSGDGGGSTGGDGGGDGDQNENPLG